MARWQRDQYERAFLTFARAITVGIAYVATSPIPGLTSSFIAIFTSLLPFDICVASAQPPIRWRDWKRFFEVVRPRVIATVGTLLKGIAVGAASGIFTLLGLPPVVGAVLTSGLAYIWALGTRHVISAYVAILAGLAVFERLADLEGVQTVRIVQEIVTVIVLSGGGTLLGLMAGWFVGFVTGMVTRAFLSRPYRSLRSHAYELPLEMRPFNEVIHVGDKSLVVTAVVEEGSPVAHRSLAELNLRDRWRTTVLSVKRDGEELVMPRGDAVLMPGDELILLTDRGQSSSLYEQFKAPKEQAALPPSDAERSAASRTEGE